jgi:hypothetical protein
MAMEEVSDMAGERGRDGGTGKERERWRMWHPYVAPYQSTFPPATSLLEPGAEGGRVGLECCSPFRCSRPLISVFCARLLLAFADTRRLFAGV